MRLVRIRICISVTGLALGALVVSATGAEAAPCPPGQPTGRPPGRPPGSPPGQPAGRPPQYPPGKCQLALSAASARIGSSVTAAGSGFAPGSAVALTLGRTAVGSPTADGNGGFTQPFTVPTGVIPGQYGVQATGIGNDGTPYEQSATFEVLPAAAGSPVAAGQQLTPGRGLAAGRLSGNTGLIAVPAAGGGVIVVPGGANAGITLPGGATVAGTTATAGAAGSSGSTLSGVVPAEQVVGGATIGNPDSSGGLSPLVLAGAGLGLFGVGAGTAVAAKRRKAAKS